MVSPGQPPCDAPTGPGFVCEAVGPWLRLFQCDCAACSAWLAALGGHEENADGTITTECSVPSCQEFGATLVSQVEGDAALCADYLIGGTTQRGATGPGSEAIIEERQARDREREGR